MSAISQFHPECNVLATIIASSVTNEIHNKIPVSYAEKHISDIVSIATDTVREEKSVMAFLDNPKYQGEHGKKAEKALESVGHRFIEDIVETTVKMQQQKYKKGVSKNTNFFR